MLRCSLHEPYNVILGTKDSDNIFSICSGFQGIYDVEHFIKALRYDVRIVESIPEIRKNGKTKKMKAVQV